MTTLTLQETNSGGDPISPVARYRYSEIRAAISLRCPRIDLKKLQHLIDIACQAVGHPVDVTHFERGALTFSARLICVDNTLTRAKVNRIIIR